MLMPDKILRILALLLFFMSLQSHAFASDRKNDHYIFGSIQNSEWNQYCATVVLQAYDNLNLPARASFLPSSRSLATSSKGKIDGEIGRIKKIGELYPTLIRVPTPYASLKGVAVYINPEVKVTSVEDLSNYRVGILRGVSFTKKLVQNTTSISVDSVEQLFKMLIRNRVDLIIISDFTAELEIAHHYQDHSIKISPTALVEFPIYHYLHQKNKDLIPKIDDELKALLNSNEIQEIRQNFIRDFAKHDF